jgi:hypothetical protein
VKRTHAIAIVGGILLLLSAVGTASATHYAGTDDNDVSHEPSTVPDFGEPVEGAGPANGFGDLPSDPATDRQDLVLNGFAGQPINTGADHNSILRTLLGEDAENVILPGLVDFEAYWGWWNDKGSGAYFQEPGTAVAGPPGGEIDDGADDHANDTHFDDAADECGTTSPNCWQTTGSWDEFIWRGPNSQLAQGNVQFQAPVDTGEGPITNVTGDELYQFVHPGTQGNWVQHALQEDTGNPLPGYGIISEGADDEQAFDNRCLWEGQVWDCDNGRFGVTYDRSLLITTKVRVAANPVDTNDALKKDFTHPDTTAVDTDIYTAPGPVGTLYRTAVWDPGDQQDSPTDVANEEGPKDTAKVVYSDTIPSTLNAISDLQDEALRPVETEIGTVDDTAGAPFVPLQPGTGTGIQGGPPEVHEPHRQADQFPGAEVNNGAEYNPAANGEYYVPTQDWTDYQKAEHLWADVNTDYGYVTPALVSSSPGAPGVNLDAIGGDRSKQDTHGPGFLSIFARVGTWLDVDGDTFIGDLDRAGRSTTSEHPYANGTVEDPNDYTDHPGNPETTANEWRGTCRANVEVTLRPLGTPTNGAGEHAWGSTQPPAGVYRYPQFGLINGPGQPATDVTGDVEVAGATLLDDPDDERFSRYTQYGPITFSIGGDCDQPKAGQFFPSEFLFFPSGSADFPVKVTGTVSLLENSDRTPRRGTHDLTQETVVDVDRIYQWT